MSEREQKAAPIAELFGLASEGPLFEQALTHPSFAHETPEAAHNQRLEFLGDAILDFVVSQELYQRFPEAAEGKLTRTRAQLVNTAALSRFARHHGFSHVLRFGKGGAQGGLSDSDNVLADAVEALIAASYLEGGLEATRRACLEVMEFGLESLQEAGARDPKSELQEKVQARGKKAPNYRVVCSTGPAHEVEFEVEVCVEAQRLATGSGRSKRLAERRAAEVALSKLDELFSIEAPSEEA
jgi:ribonuclease-3